MPDATANDASPRRFEDEASRAREAERTALVASFESRIGLLDQLTATLQLAAEDALDGARHIDRISFRRKSLDSFIAKCFADEQDGSGRKYNAPLRQIEDQIAGRVLVFFEHDMQVVSELLSGTFNLIEAERKKPMSASEFGYESHHLIVGINEHHKPRDWDGLEDMPVTFELQIRTLFMHAWAEPQHDLAYKGSDALTEDDRRNLAFAAASAWGADRNMQHAWTKLGDGKPCAT